jgi:hypothetical protein
MARLNIEESWFSDLEGRRETLANALGVKYRLPLKAAYCQADGVAVLAWRLSRRYWADGERLIPRQKWSETDLGLMVECQLAEIDENGDLYIKGTKEHHGWLLSRKEAAKQGGKKSAELREKKRKQNPSKGQRLVESCSSNFQPSSLLYAEEPQNLPPPSGVVPKKETAPLMDNLGSRIWGAYALAYQQRYRAMPVRNAKANALCKQLGQRLGGDGAISVVKFFMEHNNQFYITKGHSLQCCVADAESLHTQMLTGKQVTATQSQIKDRTQSNLEAARGAVELINQGRGNPFDVKR